jgi:hypothetical protein
MATYNPSSRYTWTPEDTFTLTGQQFGLFLNTVRAYLSSEEAARFQLMMQANKVIEELMIQGVETDIIKEVEEETSQASTMEVIK